MKGNLKFDMMDCRKHLADVRQQQDYVHHTRLAWLKRQSGAERIRQDSSRELCRRFHNPEL